MIEVTQAATAQSRQSKLHTVGEHRPGGLTSTTAGPVNSDVGLASSYSDLRLGPEQHGSGLFAELGREQTLSPRSRRRRRSLGSEADVSHTWPALMVDIQGGGTI